MSETTVLAIEGLCKRFGRVVALDGVQLTIDRGEIHGLIGLNGSGKTTTIECCLGLLNSDDGHVDVLGYLPSETWKLNGRLASVSDTPDLFPHLTVRQNLKYVQQLLQVRHRTPEEVEQILGISSYSNFRAKALSLGNKRRLSLAQALLGNPELIIFDEPFNGLDAQGIEDVLEVIKQQNENQGTTFLLASHQLAYLERICSHVSVLHDHHIALGGSLSELLASDTQVVQVKTLHTEQVCGLVNELAGGSILDVIPESTVRVALTDLTSAQLNSTLNGAGLAVDELVIERETLRELFQEVVGETTPLMSE